MKITIHVVLLLSVFLMGCVIEQTTTTVTVESVPQEEEPLEEEPIVVSIPAQEESEEKEVEVQEEEQPVVEEESSNIRSVTLADLATHNSEQDCWVAYKGQVYDMTDWLSKHPGGKRAIIPHCGSAEEFERAFTSRHGDRAELKNSEVVGEYVG